uniref:Fibropellin-1-like isoform X5 n=1 Tax=Crassostrea virginica TaxID=6565 RepID=A0A8B8EMX1_CRAVI|nr:fibropellin-1-like isoform X5 [Crassostrea virginica]
MLTVILLTSLFLGVACHKGHHYLPGEISHHQSASFLLDREKRATNCNDEHACEINKPDCQNQNEPVREEYCTGFTCSLGQTCYLSTPCPAHYTRSCIADPCASFPCEHGGTCTKLSDSAFSCSCTAGYDPATHCSAEINECESNPCQNGASCVDDLNMYSCVCKPGFVGTHCESEINECDSNPCQNGASCVDEVNRHSCVCKPGFVGTHCETEINECDSNPCQNGASCVDDLNRYSCVCKPGFVGTHCESEINECDSNPCQNGASCVDDLNRYSCVCKPGFVGTHCETEINECDSNPCQNGASCVDEVNRYSCVCKPGFVGTHCETEINECDSNPCQNGASCVDDLNRYSCVCKPGFVGTHCETEINECDSNPCQNGASCVDEVNRYSCVCKPGFVGSNCETEINECDSNPCQNGASCVDEVNRYSCVCKPGFVGSHCETEINECDSNPCQNGASCVDEVNRYSCVCKPGFVGTHCETDINECDSNPCQNGASCVDDVNMYSCVCKPGFMGTHCETEINECDSNPCQNGASCVDGVNRYSCVCKPGFVGTHCETDVNECQSAPCQNGGTCNDLVNQFECTCTERYNGTLCEKDCRPGPADILFVVDSSDSTNFNQSKDYMIGIIQRLPVGPSDFQVALLTFSWNATLQFTFDQNGSNTTLLKAVDDVMWDGGPTYITQALDLAEQVSSGSAHGRRPWVPSYVILLTDGLATDLNQVLVPAQRMRAQGIRVIGVGIGKSVSHMNLIGMSSKSSDVFSPENDDLLNTILRETSHRDCIDCTLCTNSDILFLVDNTQTGQELAIVSRTMREISSHFYLSLDDTRVGLMTFATNVTNRFSLKRYTAHNDLFPAFSRFPQLEEDANLTYALRYARDFGFASTNGGRSDSRKIIVIYSGGNWMDTVSVQSEFKRLISEDYQLFIIVTSYNQPYVNMLTNYFMPSYGIISAVSSDVYTSLQAVAAASTYQVCDKDVFTKRAV